MGCGRSDVDSPGGSAGVVGSVVGAGGHAAANGVGGTSSGGLTPSAGPGSGAGGPGSGAGGPGSGQAGVGGSEMICAPLGDPCTECISQSCAGDWCDCQGNTECMSLFNCFGSCNGDEACNQTCMTQNEGGISNVLLVSGCAGTVCDASCWWGADDFTPCQECIYKDCGTEMNSCLAQPDCSKLWDCLQQCPPLALSCHQECYSDFPNGVKALETLLQCSSVACKDDCPDD